MAAQAFESSIWEAEAGRLGRGQKSALMLLFETGFPFLAWLFWCRLSGLPASPGNLLSPPLWCWGLRTPLQVSGPNSGFPSFKASALLAEPPPRPSTEQKDPQARVLPVVLKVTTDSSLKLMGGSFCDFTVCKGRHF